jgi:hypothetical protein
MPSHDDQEMEMGLIKRRGGNVKKVSRRGAVENRRAGFGLRREARRAGDWCSDLIRGEFRIARQQFLCARFRGFQL